MKPAIVVRGNRQTHVLLPVDEYERLLRVAEAAELIAELEDPRTQWSKAEDVARRFAVRTLAEARRRAGLTQKQLADRMRVPQSQISRIERNPERTTVRTLRRIADALGVDISAMLSFAARSK